MNKIEIIKIKRVLGYYEITVLINDIREEMIEVIKRDKTLLIERLGNQDIDDQIRKKLSSLL